MDNRGSLLPCQENGLSAACRPSLGILYTRLLHAGISLGRAQLLVVIEDDFCGDV